MKILSCSEVIFVGIEHTPMSKACFACSRNVMEREVKHSVNGMTMRKIAFRGERLFRNRLHCDHGGMVAVDREEGP
jgi:hypothetical protein